MVVVIKYFRTSIIMFFIILLVPESYFLRGSVFLQKCRRCKYVCAQPGPKSKREFSVSPGSYIRDAPRTPGHSSVETGNP